MNTRLLRTIESAGQPATRLPLTGGAQALVLPHGGRVLGLYAPGSDENFLWTNTALRSSKDAARLFASDDWHNTGGDRTWLAPEADFFCPDYPSSATYFQPRQLDPGRYTCKRTANSLRLECNLRLHSYRTREDVSLTITKDVEPAAHPFHQTPGLDSLAALPFAGYTLRTSLEVRGKPKRTVVGLWNLLQMPHGGRMIVPVRFRVQPTRYFGSFSPRDLVAGEDAIRYAMRAPGEHKIGVAAIALTGRAGYLYRSVSDWRLIVRNFAVNPSGFYADALPNAGPRPGDAFQACNVSNEQLGRFSELEYHVPAIGGATGLTRCDDVSQVWAFRGTKRNMASVAEHLLGARIS